MFLFLTLKKDTKMSGGGRSRLFHGIGTGMPIFVWSTEAMLLDAPAPEEF